MKYLFFSMNEQATQITTVVLFVLTYAALLIFSKQRAYIALFSALLFVVLGIMPIDKLFFSINWNVLLMLAGTMGIVALFIESKMPALLGDIIISKTPNIKWAVICLAVFAGLVSAFIDNVATVIMIAPIAINVAKKLNTSPVIPIICISIFANLEGAATLVGDTTSILLGGALDMTFFDFFFYRGRMGLFFVIQVSMVAAVLVLLFFLRKYNQPIVPVEREKVTDYFPTGLMIALIVLLIAASFIPAEYKPEITNGLICVGLLLVGIIRSAIKHKDSRRILNTVKEIDHMTLLLLAGLFVVVASLTEAGIIDIAANALASISNNVFVVYTIIVFASVALSAVIDNIPYVAAMLPIVAGMAPILGIDPYLMYFGLLVGATLGGNITPIGASANIAALGILRKEGHEVKAGTFMKISVPITLVAVLTGYALIWLIWS